jgi:L-threonylcarbamoyladenylate synthase
VANSGSVPVHGTIAGVTDILRVDPSTPDPSAIARAAACLRDGGLVAFPTETVYGLGVHALDRDAVRRLYAAKGRPAADPLIVHVGSLEDVSRLVSQLPEVVGVLAQRFWPGPLTLVLPRSVVVPDEVTAGLETVAVRIPAHPIAQALIRQAGVPVAAPSANLFSRPSPTQASHVLEDLDGRIDLVVDGGSTRIGVESTVLDLTAEAPRILRPGGVTIDQLREVLPTVHAFERAASDGPMLSPGLLEKHYSPRAPLTLYVGDGDAPLRRLVADIGDLIRDGARVGVLVSAEDRMRLPSNRSLTVVDLGPRGRLDVVATRLYAALRELDQAGVDRILAADIPERSGLGTALHDRLTRAAAGRITRS